VIFKARGFSKFFISQHIAANEENKSRGTGKKETTYRGKKG